MNQEKNGAVPEEQKEVKDDQVSSEKIVTSFLLLARESGKIDIVVELPGVEKKRTATMRDIRDICHQVYDDVLITMISKETSNDFCRYFGLLSKIKNV